MESAIARPFQTFAGGDLYSSIIEKAAAFIDSLVINHPFVDGNKRTGAVAMVAFIQEEGYLFIAESEDFYNFVISVSTGEKSFHDIVKLLRKNTTKI